jgi:hypothetical protein
VLARLPAGCVVQMSLEKQNAIYYSVRAAIRLPLTNGGSWLVESDEWWSSSTEWHGLGGAYSAQRGAEAKSPSTLEKPHLLLAAAKRQRCAEDDAVGSLWSHCRRLARSSEASAVAIGHGLLE